MVFRILVITLPISSNTAKAKAQQIKTALPAHYTTTTLAALLN